METEHIYVNGDEESIKEAMSTAEQFADAEGFSEKDALRLRLLSEELLGLLNGITSDDYSAMFWIEGDRKSSRLHLAGKVEMTLKRREELLASARNGKNAAAKGIMGKLREMIAVSALQMDESGFAEAAAMDFYSGGLDAMASNPGQLAWSLSGYRSFIEERYIDLDASDEFENREPWDELERSVIANLADDVLVRIKGDDVEITVERGETKKK
ncbi:MAG: hypothetical protein K6G16_09510 [Lachnospiraceae bacterium]|nr:hypothetical protein [Lachnospiraceae bacterium]